MHTRVHLARTAGPRAATTRPLAACYTVGAGAVLATYAADPGPAFVWFADFALVASVIALWCGQRLLAGMAALAVLVPGLAWTAGFLLRLLAGVDPFGLAGHLFAPDTGVLTRAAAAVHVVLPALLLWLIHRLGYDARAFVAQTLCAGAVLGVGVVLAPLLADGPVPSLAMSARLAQAWLPGWLWLALLLVAYPLLIYLPGHLLLQALFGAPRRRQPRPAYLELWRRSSRVRVAPAGRGREAFPGRGLQARLRDLADFALVRRRRR
jgi:hypothetical protein